MNDIHYFDRREGAAYGQSVVGIKKPVFFDLSAIKKACQKVSIIHYLIY